MGPTGIFTSTDGLTWTDLGVGYGLNSIILANGTLIGVGPLGKIATSTDALHWNSRASNTTNTLHSITTFNGNLVISGDGTILTSPDGNTWTSTSGTPTLLSIAGSNSCLVGVNNSNTIYSSPDGVKWTTQILSTPSMYSGIAYNNGVFVVVNSNGAGAFSNDGLNWEKSLTIGSLRGVAPGPNGGFIAVGTDGTIETSEDGQTWTSKVQSFSGGSLWGVSFGNGTFVAVGQSSILTSTDGTSWTSHSSTLLQGVSFGNGTFVAVGEVAGKGSIYSSTDGFTWTNRTPGSIPYLYKITYGGGQFLAVGGSGAVLTSPDGITWTRQTSGISTSFSKVAYGNGLFFAIALDANGYPTQFLTSTNGSNWTTINYGSSQQLSGLAYGNNIYLVCYANGFLRSIDGIEWAPISVTGNPNLSNVCFLNSQFLMTGSTLSFQTSRDGLTWTNRNNAIFGNWLYDAAYGNGTVVGIVATSGTGIIQSDIFPPLGTVTVNTNYATGGTAAVNSDGVTATATATSNAGFSFFNWTQDGTVVSSAPQYSFPVSGDTSLTANFQPSTFTTWQSVNFTPTQLGDPNVSGPTASPANDGISNLMKYALGLSPMTSSSSTLPGIGTVDQNGSRCLSLNFTRNVFASDISYAVQGADDLSAPTAWQTICTFTSGAWSPSVNVTEIGTGTAVGVHVNDSVPVSTSAHRYLRMSVTH